MVHDVLAKFPCDVLSQKSDLIYDWRFTANKFVLSSSQLTLTARISQMNTCFHSFYITASLTRWRVCNLQLLLTLTSGFFLGSESRGTRDHILLPQIRDFPSCRLLRLAGSRWRYSTPPIDVLSELFASLYKNKLSSGHALNAALKVADFKFYSISS
jgi:hypothetical protein